MLEPDTFYTCASGGLGHGLPAAVGVALAHPERKVIGLLGDGSSMYAIQGLWTAAEFRLPVAFIIVNNRSYQALVEFGQHFQLSELPGTQLPHLNYCALAQSQGVLPRSGWSAARIWMRRLERAFAATHPTLVEVCVEPAWSATPSAQPPSIEICCPVR